MTVWQSQDGLSRDAFRARFLDGSAGDALVDQLRAATRGALWGQTVGELGYAGQQLAAAAQSVGVDGWPRFAAKLADRAAAARAAGVPDQVGYLRVLDTVAAPISTLFHRVADDADEAEIPAVDAHLYAILIDVTKKAPLVLSGKMSPMVYGTRMHKMLGDEVNAARIPGVTVEEPFVDGRGGYYGEIGTIRTDVLLRNASGKVIFV